MNSRGEWDEVEDEAALADVKEPRLELAAPTEEPELYFDNLDEFVWEMIVPVFRRVGDRSQFHWAADWWRYPEAVIRVDALWRAWEHLARPRPRHRNERVAARPRRLLPRRAPHRPWARC